MLSSVYARGSGVHIHEKSIILFFFFCFIKQLSLKVHKAVVFI